MSWLSRPEWPAQDTEGYWPRVVNGAMPHPVPAQTLGFALGQEIYAGTSKYLNQHPGD
jgi:hypothetical protein